LPYCEVLTQRREQRDGSRPPEFLSALSFPSLSALDQQRSLAHETPLERERVLVVDA
jgi:hypothetical protein